VPLGHIESAVHLAGIARMRDALDDAGRKIYARFPPSSGSALAHVTDQPRQGKSIDTRSRTAMTIHPAKRHAPAG
jgi:hypothetical protein